MRSESRFPAWAWWIIGLITVLAASILILSVVLGIRAGQLQIEIQRRQQLGIALQQAIDFQAEGDFQSALEQYQRALVLDPNNDTAQQGITNLFALVQAGTPVLSRQPETATVVVASATPEPAALSPIETPIQVSVSTGNSTPTIAATATLTELDELWEQIQAAVKAGRWQEALNDLNLVQQRDPVFRSREIKDLLFTVYVNLAGEKDNEDNLEEALRLYDKALALRPSDAEIRQERELIADYLDVLTYTDVDWTRAIEALERIDVIDGQYRDVAMRLQEAHAALGDQLALDEQWCDAADEYTLAVASANTADLRAKRDNAKTRCDVAGSTVIGGSQTTGAATPLATLSVGVATTLAPSVAGSGLAGGTILYSAGDTLTGRSQIMRFAVGGEKPAQLVLQDAAQPSLRADGQRLAFRNLRGNMAGLGGFDPATGLTLRFTQYVEDSLPSWNAQGSRIVFASNREGDRRWRIYVVWAEENGGTDTLGFGEAPAWHPSADKIVFRGCDTSGNNCGLWTMSGSGSNQAPLTTEPADTRPAWAPDGSFVTFMSSGRDGNPEVYRVDTASGAVTRLTDSPAVDGLPTVSPDGQWIAFVSNRDGVWKIWAVPASGGQATVVAPVVGDLGSWTDHKLIWTN